jgi:ABC-type transport system substrate-binding protein
MATERWIDRAWHIPGQDHAFAPARVRLRDRDGGQQRLRRDPRDSGQTIIPDLAHSWDIATDGKQQF